MTGHLSGGKGAYLGMCQNGLSCWFPVNTTPTRYPQKQNTHTHTYTHTRTQRHTHTHLLQLGLDLLQVSETAGRSVGDGRGGNHAGQSEWTLPVGRLPERQAQVQDAEWRSHHLFSNHLEDKLLWPGSNDWSKQAHCSAFRRSFQSIAIECERQMRAHSRAITLVRIYSV